MMISTLVVTLVLVEGALSQGTSPYNDTLQCDLSEIDSKDYCVFVSNVEDCLSTRYESICTDMAMAHSWCSRLDYLELPYCRMKSLLWVSMLILLLWLGFLFVNLALVVDFRVVPNLETLSRALNVSYPSAQSYIHHHDYAITYACGQCTYMCCLA